LTFLLDPEFANSSDNKEVHVVCLAVAMLLLGSNKLHTLQLETPGIKHIGT
jgi:cytochrome c oxidase assembly protein Cox11